MMELVDGSLVIDNKYNSYATMDDILEINPLHVKTIYIRKTFKLEENWNLSRYINVVEITIEHMVGLTMIDFSKYKNLRFVKLRSCYDLETIIFKDKNSTDIIIDIEISNLKNINIPEKTTELYLINCGLEKLDISKCMYLTNLCIYQNRLKYLDISNNHSLCSIDISHNRISNIIDISNILYLDTFNIEYNLIEYIKTHNDLEIDDYDISHNLLGFVVTNDYVELKRNLNERIMLKTIDML